MGIDERNAMDNRANSGSHRAFDLDCWGRKTPLSKMTNAQLARRKNAQADLAIVGSTLGLGALAAKGGGSAARRWMKPATKGKALAAKIDGHTNNALIAGAGVGGIAGFNSAAISRQEAKKAKRNATRVAKSAFGVDH